MSSLVSVFLAGYAPGTYRTNSYGRYRNGYQARNGASEARESGK
jgi:hypothetical protein